MVCVTFKFVCFDGIERKKLANEVIREKKKKKEKKEKRELYGNWNVLEEVVGKKGK